MSDITATPASGCDRTLAKLEPPLNPLCDPLERPALHLRLDPPLVPAGLITIQYPIQPAAASFSSLAEHQPGLDLRSESYIRVTLVALVEY
eukprot:3459558-Pyramimonas_sp.AAC.1